MIYDIITYNGEKDLFDIRYNILKDYIDEFIVVEFDKTFSGRPKESSFSFKDWPKVKYFFNTEDVWGKYMDMAKASPNTLGAEHWKTEFCQKESIKDCLTHLKDDDIVLIGDCDEIPDITGKIKEMDGINKLRLKVYVYYLNNRSSEDFYGTIITKYKHIKDSCLNHIRSNTNYNRGAASNSFYGWHFTSMKDGLRKKLEDSYTSDSYANPQVMNDLDDNIENGRDFLGRNFIYYIDESELPEYIINNKQKYVAYFK